MHHRSSRITPARVVAVSLVAVVLASSAITWTLTGGIGRDYAAAGTHDPGTGRPWPWQPRPAIDHDSAPTGQPSPNTPATGAGPGTTGAAPGTTGAAPTPGAGQPGTAGQSGGQAADPGPGSPAPARADGAAGGGCRTGHKLIPTCGVLWGVAPGAGSGPAGSRALRDFETRAGRPQAVFHTYHRGTGMLIPTRDEIAMARQPGRERILLVNWKPNLAWSRVAKGDPKVDAYLDRVAAHVRRNFPEEFFFAIHHEAEDNVRDQAGSGYTARDFAAMYRHVIQRLRAHGARNVVSVLVRNAYGPITRKPWFDRMYPGDDVVDWIGWDTYAHSDPGYGHGDFAEMLNRRSGADPGWPGFYNWVTRRHPNKPLMVAEWGVWQSRRNPSHKADFYRSVGQQISRFPRVRALVYFDTPRDPDGRDSRINSTPQALAAYRRLGALPVFQVKVRPNRW